MWIVQSFLNTLWLRSELFWWFIWEALEEFNETWIILSDETLSLEGNMFPSWYTTSLLEARLAFLCKEHHGVCLICSADSILISCSTMVPPGRLRDLRDGSSNELLSNVGLRTHCSPGGRPGTAIHSASLFKWSTKLIGRRSLLWDVRRSSLSKRLTFWRQANSSEKKSIFSEERWSVQSFVVRVYFTGTRNDRFLT
jgi:hypothetical protein